MYVIPRKCVSDSHKKRSPLGLLIVIRMGLALGFAAFEAKWRKNPDLGHGWESRITKKRSPLGLLIVIRMGLEPMTRSLEGCCSNPTELPNQPWLSLRKAAAKLLLFADICKFIVYIFFVIVDLVSKWNVLKPEIALNAQKIFPFIGSS